MDWTVIIAVCAAAAAGIMGWKLWKMKRDVYEFADALEESLDAVIQGRRPRESGETEDTLLGRVNEKLRRVFHILEKKEEETARSRQQIRELISDISHQTDRLDFLFRSLVKMSRLETGVIQIRKETADLIQTLGCAVAAVVPAASKKNIVLSVEREDGEGALELPHDKKWTEEAIYNLLDNAVKYTTQGGRVTVRVQRREIFTEIHVRDTGKGIAPERHARIFTRFYREPEVHGQDGLGIGLYLTRKIAEMQGGYVEVRSEEGAGADFCIYLPNEQQGQGQRTERNVSGGSAVTVL